MTSPASTGGLQSLASGNGCKPAAAMSRRACLGAIAGAAIAARRARAAEGDDEQPHIVLLGAGGAEIEVQFAPGFDASVRDLALEWVRVAADAVIGYFGTFPVPRLELLVQPVEADGVLSGASYGEPSPLIRIRLGRATSRTSLRDDWVLVHEMIHLAIPRVPRAQNWLHEGIATYVEAVARGRAGLVSPAVVWHRWVRLMPQGQPRADDRGLDQTPTWARTYWGGAMFCLLADVRMRQRGSVDRGLQQALQGVLAAGGDYRASWPVARILATADAAVGQTALTDLYQLMKDRGTPADLEGLWRDLGVEVSALRDDAPLAAVRRAILS